MTIKIFCEDRKGKPFFERLINRMKREGIAGNISIKVGYIGGCVGSVLERRIRASMRDCSKFIIVYDAHGRNVEEVRKSVWRFVPDAVKVNSCIVILDFEIEEWICVSEGIDCGNEPYKTLKHKIGYEKYKLPDFAERLNFERLRGYRSFDEFLDCLERLSKIIDEN